MKMTTAQVAEKLGITDRHVRRLISEGKLYAQSVNGEWEVPEESIDCYHLGKILVVIRGGTIKVEHGYHYYFEGPTEYTMVYGPRMPQTKDYIEKLLQDHLDMTREQYGDKYMVKFERIDKDQTGNNN